MRNRTKRHRSKKSTVVIAATALAVLGTALAPPATAQTALQGGSAVRPTPPSASTPEDTASKAAREAGKPVEVLARRTETSQLFANPSGTYTQEQYVLPRWTRKDNKLVPIDTELAPTADGRIAPKATTAGLSFSDGGTGPAVTLVRDGRKIALTWPAPLPKPTTTGDTATYPEVLPGVDLLLRAGNAGFSQLLVVKTPKAAANPALKSIRFAMAADGVAVSADSHGNLNAVDPAGREVFTAPTPRMWDSTTSAAPGPAARASAEDRTPPTDRFEPGYGAKEAEMGLALGKDSLTLAPNQPLLTGSDTTYPVYIDPTFSISGAREAWAIAYKRTPNTAYFNGAGWHNGDGTIGTNVARAGYENITDGLARSFFRMDSNNLWNTNKKIKTSTFRIKNTWSWSCENRSLDLWLTGVISSSTTWASQDNSSMWLRKLASVNESLGWGSGCPAGNLAFDVTSVATEAATKKLNNITLALRATNESDVYSWKKFDAGSATLTTTYNTYPNLPSNLWTAPDTNTDGCLGGMYLYKTIGNTNLTLGGTFTDPDGGTLKARFVLWPDGHGGPTNEVNQLVDVTSGKGARLPILKETLKKLQTDIGETGTGTFSWHARAEDGELVSAWSPVCTFKFDPWAPSFAPRVTSSEFPDGADGWPETTAMARSEGSFLLENMDAEPVAAFEYWTDWDATVRKVSLGYLGGHVANVELTPPSVGRHALSVRAIDRGGNISDTTRYWFYANGTGIPDKPGDLNGDGLADFYGIRTNGELWFYGGHGTTGVMAPYTVASNHNFGGADITRRGDWTQDGYEDLLALNPDGDGKTLTVHPNNGFGYACSARGEEADGVSKACLYDKIELSVYLETNNHWSDASEVLAIGDVDGPLDTNADGVVDVPGHPDLLVKQGNLLWLYFGSADHRLDSYRDPKLVGSGGWASFTLAAPGDRNKDGSVDLIARNTTNGELRFYPGTGTSGGFGVSSVIGTGWTTSYRPLITAVPDANGDGTPDVWTTGGDGKLYFYPNVQGTGNEVGSGGWSGFQDLS